MERALGGSGSGGDTSALGDAAQWSSAPGRLGRSWCSHPEDHWSLEQSSFFLKIYLFTFGCSGSSLLLGRFSSLASGATLGCGARASHCKVRSIGSRVRRRQQSRCTGLAAPRHVGSSPTRDRTRVSCSGRRILYHRVSREVLEFILTVFPDSGQAIGWDIAVLVRAHYQCLSPAAPCSPSEAQAGWLLVVL